MLPEEDVPESMYFPKEKIKLKENSLKKFIEHELNPSTHKGMSPKIRLTDDILAFKQRQILNDVRSACSTITCEGYKTLITYLRKPISYDLGISPCKMASVGWDWMGPAGTLTSPHPGPSLPKVVVNAKNNERAVRKLMPQECWRLMGMSDEDYDKIVNEVTPSQIYKQAGNSIVVDVLVAIFDAMLSKPKQYQSTLI